MNAGQRRLLSAFTATAQSVILELTPRIIEPSKEIQKTLNLPEVAMLFQIGSYRAVAVYPAERDFWAVKEFNSSSGSLVPLRETGVTVAPNNAAKWLILTAMDSMDDQLARYQTEGVPDPEHEKSRLTIARHRAVLEQRLTADTSGASASVGDAAAGSDLDDEYLG
ncbi:MAG: hypothetical protein ACOH1J_03175 [Microbacteriaceae bacterium]